MPSITIVSPTATDRVSRTSFDVNITVDTDASYYADVYDGNVKVGSGGPASGKGDLTITLANMNLDPNADYVLVVYAMINKKSVSEATDITTGN